MSRILVVLGSLLLVITGIGSFCLSSWSPLGLEFFLYKQLANKNKDHTAVKQSLTVNSNHRLHKNIENKQKNPLAPSLPAWNDLDPDMYSYDDYLHDVPEKMVASTREYNLRKAIFDRNFDTIRIYNFDQEAQTMDNRGHRLGLNQFMDLFPYELPPPGYDKRHHELWNQNPIKDNFLAKTDSISMQNSKKHQFDYWSMIEELTYNSTTELPQHVDWRIDVKTGHPLATPVKSQGKCGSCWAFATTAAMESHIALHTLSTNHTPILLSLSMQELVSCVPNPNHCGGTGACDGSTAELALEYIAVHGLVDEWHLGYQSFDFTPEQHHKFTCPLDRKEETTQKGIRNNYKDNEDDDVDQYFEDAVATVKGYVKLPSNNYTALMHAVAKYGPVIVNVAADPWRFYEGGVFTLKGHSIEQTDINHVVVLMGYGTDDTTGEDYWLVRNSHGPFWGEEGYIRLKRVDPQTLPQPDADCGMDVRPAHGIACTEQDDDNNHGYHHHHHHHHHITPPAVKVCGTSGILFDPVLPVGARVIVQ